MANGLVNVKGVTAEEIAAVEEILDDVITLLGATNNTGGTATAGTVMAKLNKLLTDWTAARAGYIDAINTNTARLTSTRAGYIDKLVNFGTTSDTGGTSTAGTVMAKLNKLLTDWTNVRAIKLDNIGATADTGGTASAGTIMAKLNKLLTDWTTTRAGRIDTINSAIGTTSNTGGTATAGTVMAKLNKILEEATSTIQYKISNTVRYTTTKNVSSVALGRVIIQKIYQFHAKYDGCICAYATTSAYGSKWHMYVMRSLHDYVNTSGSIAGENGKTMTHPSVYTAAVGSILSSFLVPKNITLSSVSSSFSANEETNLIYGSNHSSSGDYKGTVLLDTTIPVKKGEEVAFIVSGSDNTDVTLQLKYDEVKI